MAVFEKVWACNLGKLLARRRLAGHNSTNMIRKLVILSLLIAVPAGCVRRELEITSEPEGAVVYVSDIEVGRTPVVVPFTYYGDRDIILRMDGYQTEVTHANITPPWYEIPPIDLFSEIAPWTYYDRRFLHYTLTPLEPTSREELIRRAEQMAKRNVETVEK